MRRRSFAAVVVAAAALLFAGAAVAQVDLPVRPQEVVGQILVASPKLEDARFRQTLIYVARHDQQGAFGIVLNKPQGVGPLDQVLRAYRLRGPTTDQRVTVYWGGPVETGRGFVLHTTDYGLNGALMVAGNLAVSRVESIALAIAEGRGPRLTMMAFGYTNWGAGQLDREITAGDWLVISQDEKLIFSEPDANKWRRAFGAFGMDL